MSSALALLPDLALALGLLVAVAQGWNLTGGLDGRPSLGHAAFLGLGAHGTALLAAHAGVSPWAGVWIAALAAAGLGAALGLATARLRASAFALVTLAAAELLRHAAALPPALPPGALRAPPLELLGASIAAEHVLPWAAVALAGIATGLVAAARRGRLGLALGALADDYEAARALGIAPLPYRAAALSLSALVTALAGGLLALAAGGPSPEHVLGLAASIGIALPCLLGGPGTTFGPVLGASLVAAALLPLAPPALAQHLHLRLPAEALARHGEALLSAAAGALLAAVALLLPGGLAALPGRLRRRRAPSSQPEPAEPAAAP
jgi:branched-chain amino acid transport system permease protein